MRSLSCRFYDKVVVDQSTGCFLWTGAKTRGVYGHMRVLVDGIWKMVRAHIISYQMNKGEIPEGMVIRHTCDNPPCVNSEHLILGTYQDNTDDKVSRGRHKWGITAKIDLTLARLIRGKKGTNQELAEQFGLSPTSISYIKNNKRWKESAGGLEN